MPELESRATGEGEVFDLVFIDAPCTRPKDREYRIEARPKNARMKTIRLAVLWRSDGDREQAFLDLWRKVSGIAWSIVKREQQ